MNNVNLSYSATGHLVNLTMAGPLLLAALFQGSARLSESITASKYSAYPAYREQLFMFWGNFCSLRTDYPELLTKKRT